MEFHEVVRRRRMVRNYTGEPVAHDTLRRILDVARRAPSAGFSQGQSFVVVTDPGMRRRIAELAGECEYVARGFDPWLSAAPVHVVPCVRERDYRDRYAEADKAHSVPPDEWPVPFWWIDGGATLMLLLLATVAEGLAAGFQQVGRQGLRDLLGIPDDVSPIGLVTVGHAAPDRPSGSLARGRRPFEDTVRWERW